LQKVLIIGANGFLGSKLIHHIQNENYSHKFIPIAADIQNNTIPKEIDFKRIDITNREKTIETIKKINPNTVILTAAYTNVDECEDKKKLAHDLNFLGPENVALGCKKINSKIIFLSTDFVFDGKKGDYSETDEPKPLNHYAKTKLQGEKRIIKAEVDYIICRTAVLYGWYQYRQNFITWILNNLEKGNKIDIITEQINSPTLANNLAEILLHLIEYNKSEIIHTVGDCALNRYEMAVKCAEVFNFSQNLIQPIKFFKQKAIRPKNASLNISKLKKILGNKFKVLNLDEGLNFMKKHRDL